MKRTGRQLGAGFVETYGSSPKAAEDFPGIGHVVPNFLWGIASMPELARTVGYAAFGKEAPYNPVTTPSMQYLQSGIANAEEMTGASREQSTVDMGLRILGGGGFMSLPIKMMAKAPSAVKAILYGLTPTIQSKTLAGAVAENVIPTLIADQMMEVADPEYESLVNSIVDAEAYPKIAVKPDNVPQSPVRDITQEMADALAGNPHPADEMAATLAQIDPEIQGAGAADTLMLNGVLEEDDTAAKLAGESGKRDWIDNWMGIAGSTAAIAATLYLGAKGKAKYTTKFYNEFTGASDLISNRALKQKPAKVKTKTTITTGIYDDIDRGYYDKTSLTNANLRDPFALLKITIQDMKKAGTIGAEAAKKLGNDVVTTLELPALGNKIKAFAKSGYFPGSESLPNAKRRKTIPLGYLEERIAGLDAKSRTLYEDALVAGTKIDDLNLNPSLLDEWGDLTKADLQKTYNKAMNAEKNPIVKALVEDTHKYFNDFREYLYESGVLDATTYDKWKSKGRYAPLRYADSADYGTDFRMARQLEDATIQPGNILPPSEMLGEYSIRMIKFAEHNKLRARFLKNLADSPLATRDGKRLVRLLDDGENIKGETVSVFAGGEKIDYQVHDPFLKELMVETPQWAENYYTGLQLFMVNTAKMVKNLTTGKFAWQFAPVSTQYEKMLAIAQHPQGKALSWVGKHAGKTLKDKYDPTVLLAEIPGTIRGVWADVHYAGARKLHAMLADETNTPILSKMISPENREVLAQIMEDGYINSSKYNYEKYGGGASALWGDVQDDLPQIVTEVSAKAGRQAHKTNFAANTLANLYMHGRENFHSSVRLEGAASNMMRRKVTMNYYNKNGKRIPIIRFIIDETAGDIEDSVRAMRELTGDLGKKGGLPGTNIGDTTRFWQDSTPYLNVALQAIGKFGKAFVDRPAQSVGAIMATVGATITYVVTDIMSDPVKRKEFQKRSATERGRRIPFYNDKGELVYEYAIPHEWRPMYAAALEGTLHTLGYQSPQYDVWQDSLNAAISVAMSDLLPDPIPVAAKAAATGILGQRLPQIPLGRYGFSDVQKNRLLPEDDAALISQFRGVIQEITGASAQMLVGTAEELYMGMRGEKSWEDAVAGMNDWLHVRETRTGQLPISLPILGKTGGITPKTYSIAGQPPVEYYHDTLKKSTEWLRLFKQGNEHRAATKAQPTSAQSFWARGMPGKMDMQGEEGHRKAIILSNMENLSRALSKLNIPSTLKDQTFQKEMNQLERQFSDPRSQEAMKNQLFTERMKQYEEGMKVIRDIESTITDELAKIGIDEAFTFNSLPSSPKLEGWGAISPNMNKTDPFVPRINQ